MALDANVFNQFKTFKANNELYIRIDDVIPNLNNIVPPECANESAAMPTETSMIAAFDRPGGMPHRSSGEYSAVQTLENPGTAIRTKDYSLSQHESVFKEDLKQPEILDCKVVRNGNVDVAELVPNRVSNESSQLKE